MPTPSENYESFTQAAHAASFVEMKPSFFRIDPLSQSDIDASIKALSGCPEGSEINRLNQILDKLDYLCSKIDSIQEANDKRELVTLKREFDDKIRRSR